MTAQHNPIKALISNIDEALSLSNPRPPLVVMGDSIIQSRQVLEQVRSFLLSLELSPPEDAFETRPRYGDLELESLEQSLRLMIREELNQLQSQFTQTIQAEIQAMRQERRVLIRELRWLRQQRQQAETDNNAPVVIVQAPSVPSPEPEISTPSETRETASTVSEEETQQNESIHAEAENSLASVPVESESARPEPEIYTPSETRETLSTVLEEETPENESIHAEAENSPSSDLQASTPTVVSLNLNPAKEINNLEISSDVPKTTNQVFGGLNVRKSRLESQAIASPSLTPTHPSHQTLEPESYIQASPNENLLPHEQDEDDEDPVDSHLMVGKSVRQLLEEDLLNLEQQSFIGEEDPSSDFSNVDLTPTADSSQPFAKTQNVETFEDLWSQTPIVEGNPFLEADLSEITLDQLVTTVDGDEVKTINSERESDLEDLNFEALNRKLQP